MAKLITRDELIERIDELQEAANSMVAPTQRVCEKCLMFYNADEISHQIRHICYCDFDSDRSFE